MVINGDIVFFSFLFFFLETSSSLFLALSVASRDCLGAEGRIETPGYSWHRKKRQRKVGTEEQRTIKIGKGEIGDLNT